MQGILTALKESNLFRSIDVIELIDEDTIKLLKLKARVTDGTLLYIAELHSPTYQKYSYHWQKEGGEVISRWDNKPHWKAIKTFPHHKHEGDKILPSHRATVIDVIQEIKSKVSGVHGF